MRAIADKIRQESYKSHILRELALDESIENSIKIRKEQQEHYDKFNFYKNLNDAMNKIEKRNEDEQKRNYEESKKDIKQKDNN